jgi:hypothetical protein
MSQVKIIKTSLINIDSSYRQIFPKNICFSNGQILPTNPITLTTGSNLINFNCPDHKLKPGDNITVSNIDGITKIIVDSVYLIKGSKYAVFVFDTNNISIKYKNYTDKIFCNIDLVGNQMSDNSFDNIKLNDLLGIKKSLIASVDLTTSALSILTSSPDLILLLSTTSSLITSVLNTKCILIELPLEYDSLSNYYQINQVLKISYLHIGGIPLGYLNANYPINNYNYQSSFEVTNVIDSNNFSISINLKSFENIQAGGSNIIINKIINTIVGYPDADEYSINLKKSFNNVTNIELVSSEFPYVDLVIKKNQNDKLYWKHIDDGSYQYSVTIDEGFYSSESFLKKITMKMNSIKRVNNNLIGDIFNHFDISIESNIQKIIFKPYDLCKLPNSLSISKENINNTNYFILTINHPNNFVSIGDKILISNSSDVSVTSTLTSSIEFISASYINSEHTVRTINTKNFTYDIILGSVLEIPYGTSDNHQSGGENIIIKSKTKVSFLFDKSDTCGDIIGFRDVGNKYSIIDFSSEISNYDSYVNSINLNPVGNIISYSSNFINFVGKYNYFLMYLNDIEYIYSNNNLKSPFAKIQLSGNPGDILFNTFIRTPSNIYYKGFPISTLSELTIKFTYPDGTRINFRNINHSFTLKITEELIQNDNTYLNSQNISVINEFKNAQLKD